MLRLKKVQLDKLLPSITEIQFLVFDNVNYLHSTKNYKKIIKLNNIVAMEQFNQLNNFLIVSQNDQDIQVFQLKKYWDKYAIQYKKNQQCEIKIFQIKVYRKDKCLVINTNYPYFHNITKYYSNLRQVFNKIKTDSSFIYIHKFQQITEQIEIYCVQFCKNFKQIICIGNKNYLNQEENYLKIGNFCFNLQKLKNNISKRVFYNILNINKSNNYFQSMFDSCLRVNYQKYRNELFFALLFQQKGLIIQAYYKQIIFNEACLPKIVKQNFYQIKFLNLKELILENVINYQFLLSLNVNAVKIRLKINEKNHNADIFRTMSKISQMKILQIGIFINNSVFFYTQQTEKGKQVWDFINISKLNINDDSFCIFRFQGLKINEAQIMKIKVNVKQQSQSHSDYFKSKIIQYQNNSKAISKKFRREELTPLLSI